MADTAKFEVIFEVIPCSADDMKKLCEFIESCNKFYITDIAYYKKLMEAHLK
jgi:hypothetical protein